MKYVISNDIKLILNKYKKYLLLYFVLLLCFVFVQILMKNPIDKDLIIKTFGLNANRQDFLAFIMFAFHLTFFVYIAVILFTNDLKNSQNNLFLRIDIRKWFLRKILSIITITVAIEIIAFALITFTIFLKYKFLIGFLHTIIIDLLFMITFLSFVVACYINKIYLLCIILIFYFINKANFLISDINIKFLIIFFLLNLLMSSFFIKKARCKIFEEF